MIQLEPNLRNRVLLSLLYGTGLRVSEACGLRSRDIELLADPVQFAVTGKARRSRTIPLPHSVAGELISLCDDCGLTKSVFQSRSGKPLDRSRVLRIVKDAAAQTNIRFTVGF